MMHYIMIDDRKNMIENIFSSNVSSAFNPNERVYFEGKCKWNNHTLSI